MECYVVQQFGLCGHINANDEGEPYIIFDADDGVYQGSVKDAIKSDMVILI